MSVKNVKNENASRTALYRFYDTASRLLYVGITEQVGRRWDAHMRLRPWWPEVHRQTVDWFDTREEATEAEVTAIASERPRHNAHHSTQLPENVVLGSPWHCPSCDWNTVDLAEQMEHMEGEARRIAGNKFPSLRAEYLMRQIVWARNAFERAAVSLNRAEAALAGTLQDHIVRPTSRPVARIMPDFDASKLLDDVASVIGPGRIRLSKLPELLRRFDPDYLPYHGIKGTHIAAALRAQGIRVTITDNVPRLDPIDLRREAS